MTEQISVFISYKHKDAKWVRQLVSRLQAEPLYDIWFDEEDIVPGDDWADEMQVGIENADACLICVGSDEVSRWMKQEVKAAIRKKVSDKLRVIPIIQPDGNSENMPYWLEGTTYVAFDDDFEDAYHRLTLGLNKLLSPHEETTPTKITIPAIKERQIDIIDQLVRTPKVDFIFANVPSLPIHFVGRGALVKEVVHELVNEGSRALSSQGQGGVGKTTLAVVLAYHKEIHNAFDGVLWGALGTAPNLMGILADWGTALGADLTPYPDIPSRREMVKRLLSDRRMLLLIDDAWETEHAEALRAGGPNCIHLLTTRDEGIARKFAGAGMVKAVEPLEDSDAYKLLQLHAPEICATFPAETRALANEVDGLPLAIELLGAYLEASDAAYFDDLAAEAIEELRDPATRLEQATKRLGDTTGIEMTLAETLALSLSGLPVETVNAFYALGAFAPKPESFTRTAAEAVATCDAKTLAALLRRGLLGQTEDDKERLTIHKTLHDLAGTKMDAEAKTRHANYYLELANADRKDWQTIENAYPQNQWAWEGLPEEGVLEYVWALSAYQGLRGLGLEKIKWIERGLAVVAEEKDKGTLLNNLALTYNALGQRDKALEYYQQSLSIDRELGDRAGEAATLNNIGMVYNNLGQRDKALEYYQQSLSIDREHGDHAGEATTLNNIGAVYNNLGQRGKALEYYQQALPIMREVGDRAGESVTLGNIGLVYDNLGQRERALEYYEQDLAIVQEVGDRAGEATTLNNIGLVYDNLGQRDKALDFYQQALPIRRAVGDRSGEATTLNNIGAVYTALGQRDKALEFYQQALPIRRAVGDRAGEAVTLNNIGMVYRALGQNGKALEYYQQTLPIMREVGNRAGEAVTLNNIGMVYNVLGQREKALDFYQQALPIRRAVGDRAGESVTRYNMAMIYEETGRLAKAVAEMRIVVQLKEAVKYPELERYKRELAQMEERLKGEG